MFDTKDLLNSRIFSRNIDSFAQLFFAWHLHKLFRCTLWKFSVASDVILLDNLIRILGLRRLENHVFLGSVALIDWELVWLCLGLGCRIFNILLNNRFMPI
jgi:hypothetical protein